MVPVNRLFDTEKMFKLVRWEIGGMEPSKRLFATTLGKKK